MASTYGVTPIEIQRGPRSHWMFQVGVYPVGASQTYIAGAVLKNDGSGNSIVAANDPTSAILGIALHPATAIYNPASGVSTVFEPTLGVVLGLAAPTLNVGLESTDEAYQHIALGISGQVFTASATGTTWAAADVGKQYALKVDSTTGYWVVDLTNTSNAAVNIVGLASAPLLLSNGTGYAIPAVGDTNVRVFFTFASSVLDASVASL